MRLRWTGSSALRFVGELAGIVGLIALLGYGGRAVYRKLQEPCAHLADPERTDCRFFEAAVFDLDHPTPENAAVRRIECSDYIRKANAYLRNVPEGRDKARRFVERCAAEVP